MVTESKSISIPIKKYTGVAARILKLLSSGVCSQEQAARAIGVDPSYVSQLCAESDFQLQIAEELKKGIEQAVAIDETYGDIEKNLSSKLKELVPWMTSPETVLRTLKFVNEAKRKTQVGSPEASGMNGSANGSEGRGIVKLQLPNVIIQNFVVNPNNEIVAIGDKELVTLNSASLNQLVKSKTDTKQGLPKVIDVKEIKSSGSNSKDKWSEL